MYGPSRHKPLVDNKRASASNMKPSQDDLESIKLRPIFFSFPPPRNGHSPPRLTFQVPQYDYSSRAHDDNSPVPSESTKPEKSFKIRSNRDQSTLCGAISNCTNYFIGVGVLGLPYAFRCTGWLGLPVLIILGISMSYTGRLLGRCQREHSLWTYPDIAEVRTYCMYVHDTVYDDINLPMFLPNLFDWLDNSWNCTVTAPYCTAHLHHVYCTVLYCTDCNVLYCTLRQRMARQGEGSCPSCLLWCCSSLQHCSSNCPWRVSSRCYHRVYTYPMRW